MKNLFRLRMFTILLSGFGLLNLGACGNIAISDDCKCGFYTIQGTDRMMHWKEGSTVPFRLDEKLPESYKLAMHQVANEYNAVLAKTKIKIEETRSDDGEVTQQTNAPAYNTSNPRSVNGDGVNGIYWVTEKWPWEQSDPNSDAMTVLSFDKNGIIEADIYFRAENFGDPSMSVQKSQSLFNLTSGYDIQAADSETKWVFVLGLHEMGHAIGRVHTEDRKSVMYKSVGLSFVKQSFTLQDLETLSNAYSIKEGLIDSLKESAVALTAWLSRE